MSTNGAYGFRINGIDKVAYNHFDSYPTAMGVDILHSLMRSSMANVQDVAELIKLVNCNYDIPTEEEIAEMSECGLKGVFFDILEYVDFDFYLEKNLNYMIDRSDLLSDGLFCTWAYIVNLDNGKLEVYKGGNTKESDNGRYSKLKTRGINNYYGVNLVREFKLVDIFDGLVFEEEFDIIQKVCHL